NSVVNKTLLLLAYSCIEGFKDDQIYDPGIYNTTLQSPEEIIFSASADGSTLSISWPVVPGAGGYEVTILVVDDPENPDTLRHYDHLDYTSTSVEFMDDTKYEAVVRSLGNERYNNKEAQEATVEEYDTLVETYKIIESGKDLAEYFKTFVFPDKSEWEYDEIVLELEKDGVYTLNSPLDLISNDQFSYITLRGDKVYHPTVTLGEKGELNTNIGGIKLKFIDFDCTATGSSSPFIRLTDDFNEKIISSEGYYVLHPIALTGCNFTSVNGYFIYGNSYKYCVNFLAFTDCQVELNSTQEIMSVTSGFINNLTMQNCTFYNLKTSSNRFLRFANNTRPAYADEGSGVYNYHNNTFVNIATNTQWHNGGMGYNTVTVNSSYNIFFETATGNVSRYMSFNSTNPIRNYSFNCYWFDKKPAEQSGNGHDQSSTIVTVDPGLSLDDLETGVFVPSQAMIDLKMGDPRWWDYEEN
ncbi:MAG: DUF4992 family lipoprotein, partial [Rikenellaceae bacterium]|nr:DUF4992 family lipoprotein [Rikenellaceae bacterium]